MITSNNQKPCVVQTPQGFSVSYNNHFLYSKYNPSKLILQTIQNTNILPGSIILCISPILEYGLKELYYKLPEDCLMVLCEKESNLYDFSIKQNSLLNEAVNSNLIYPTAKSLDSLPFILFNFALSGKYKRVIRIDFSAGVQFNKEYYNELESACINSIATFWKNRITLTKFGRKYSQNLFKNLNNLPNSVPIENFFNKINKPILIFGAGQSIDLFFQKNKLDYYNFYILCADTALQPLLKRNIIPDSVFIEEAQTIISKAFIGSYSNIHLFAGLSSLPALAKYLKPENISYFTTEYTNAKFIDNLKSLDFLPHVNRPFGSVGITAVYYAIKFRKDDSIPIYVTGLDFSYSLGFTHAKGTLAHISRLTNTNKLIPVENYGAYYSSSSIPIKDKNGDSFVTTPTLKSYAEIFNNLFSSYKNIFDSGECGYTLNIPKANPTNTNLNDSQTIIKGTFSTEQKQNILKYLLNEQKELFRLRDLLTNKIKLPEDQLKEEIKKIASEKEYLYLHFPDGYSFNYNQSFLNRIRTEIDFFLKCMS